MRMWTGSHKDNFKNHKDTFDEDNLLTRGQTIENVPVKDTIPIILKPGQFYPSPDDCSWFWTKSK